MAIPTKTQAKKLPLHKFIATGGKPKNYKGANNAVNKKGKKK